MIRYRDLNVEELALLAYSKFGDLTAQQIPTDWRAQLSSHPAVLPSETKAIPDKAPKRKSRRASC